MSYRAGKNNDRQVNGILNIEHIFIGFYTGNVLFPGTYRVYRRVDIRFENILQNIVWNGSFGFGRTDNRYRRGIKNFMQVYLMKF